jgi:hypothetical protein
MIYRERSAGGFIESADKSGFADVIVEEDLPAEIRGSWQAA